jgi:hypothetical protein
MRDRDRGRDRDLYSITRSPVHPHAPHAPHAIFIQSPVQPFFVTVRRARATRDLEDSESGPRDLEDSESGLLGYTY